MVIDRNLRLVRGLTVALSGVALPVSGHLMAGGATALSASTLAVLVFVAAVTTAVSSREWTLPRIIVTLLPVQALVHVSMSTQGGHGPQHLSATSTAPAGDNRMLVAHGLALAALAVWLRAAERALLAFVALIDRIFVRLGVTWSPSSLARPQVSAFNALIPTIVPLTRYIRGPPQLSFV